MGKANETPVTLTAEQELEITKKDLADLNAKYDLLSAQSANDAKTAQALLDRKDEVINELKKANQEQEELIEELQEQISAQDNDGLKIPGPPTVKFDGETYLVTARKFRLKGDPKTYELEDLRDQDLVRRLVESKAGYLVKK